MNDQTSIPAPKGRKRFMAFRGPISAARTRAKPLRRPGKDLQGCPGPFPRSDFTSFMNSQVKDRREEKPCVTNRSPFAICDKC